MSKKRKKNEMTAYAVNPGPGRSMAHEDYLLNPHLYEKNPAGTGAFVGSLIGLVPGVALGSPGLAYAGNVAGAAIGGHMAAPTERKTRGAVGGAAGAAVFGPLGAALGGWISGEKKKRKNPARKTSEDPARLARQAARHARQNAVNAANDAAKNDAAKAMQELAAAAFQLGKMEAYDAMTRFTAVDGDPKVRPLKTEAYEKTRRVLSWVSREAQRGVASLPRALNPGPGYGVSNAAEIAAIDGDRALKASERALKAMNDGKYETGAMELAATAYYIGACEAHLLHDPGGDHTEMYYDKVGRAAINAINASEHVKKKVGKWAKFL